MDALDAPALSMLNFNIKFNFERLAMEQVSMLDFRRDAENIIRKVRQGKRFVMTYRGRPVMRLEPIETDQVSATDPFYALGELAEPCGGALSNEEIDRIVYQA